MIFDVRAALRHIHRILKPGGVFLMTSHGISPINRREGVDNWGEYWHFTTQSIKHLYEEIFPSANFEITSYGNVLSAAAFLYGLATEELKKHELDYQDPKFELLIGVRAVKSDGLL
jgi:ubiquinone/menaquinone biosynthesis C-methylase UbiE